MIVFCKNYRMLPLGNMFSYRKRHGSIPPSSTPNAGDYRQCGEAYVMCQRNDFGNKPPLEGSPSQSLQWCPQGSQGCVCAQLHLIGEPPRCIPSGQQTTMVHGGGLKKYQRTGSGSYTLR
jgi:hypothetical protein